MTRAYALSGMLFGALLAQIAWWVWVLPPNHDEGWILHAAFLSGEGLVPYVDYGFSQGPAVPGIYAVLQGVFGPGLLGGRVATALMCFVMVVCIFDSVRRLSGPRPACLVLALLVCDPYLLAQFCQVKTYSLAALGLSSAIWCWAFGERQRGVRRTAMLIAAGGVLAFVAVGVRLSLLPVLVVWVGASFRRGAIHGGFTAFGALVGGLVAAYPAWSASWDLVAWNVLGVHLAAWVPGEGFSAFVLARQCLGMVTFMAWVLAVWFGVWAWASRTTRGRLGAGSPRDLPLGVMLLVGILAHLLPGGRHGEYVVVVWPCLAVLAGGWAAQGARLRPLVGGCLGGLLLAHWGFAWARLGPAVHLEGPGIQSRAIGKALRAGLDPSQRILTFHPLVAVEARRRLVEGLEMGPFSLVGSGDAERWGRLRPEEVQNAVLSENCGAVVASDRDFSHDAYNRGIDSELAGQLRLALEAGAEQRFGSPVRYQSVGQFEETASLYMKSSAKP